VNRACACTIAFGLFLFAVSVAHADTRNVTLEWTAPGDDGFVGKASLYEMRFSRYPITQENFMMAPRLNGVKLPGPAGTHETMTVFGLELGTPYYFAMRTIDDAGNMSKISNVAYVSPGVADVENRGLTLDFASPRPNPAGTQTSFAVTLPKSELIRIEAFDLAGRKIRTIAQGTYSGGAFDIKWDLRDDGGRMLLAGTYLVRGQLGENVFLRRVNVIR